MDEIVKSQKPSLTSGAKVRAIVPTTIEEAARLADGIFQSGMAPASYECDRDGKSGRNMTMVDEKKTKARLLIGILKAMEVGFAPITGISNIYIVNNRPTIYGDGIPALLYGSGKVLSIQEWEDGSYPDADYRWTCKITRADSPDPIERSFSMADAKRAGHIGKSGPWSQYPTRMLQMRARGLAARDGAADILCGLGIYEEVIDIPQRPDTGSTPDISFLDDQKSVEPPMATDPLSAPQICSICNGEGIIKHSYTNEEGNEVDTIEPCECQSTQLIIGR